MASLKDKFLQRAASLSRGAATPGIPNTDGSATAAAAAGTPRTEAEASATLTADLGKTAASVGPFQNSSPLQDILTEIPLHQIEPDPDQPRRNLGDLTDLKASIAAVGVVQPITVSVLGYEKYRIVAGERRFQAARELELARIPAIVRTVEENRRLQMQIVENLHRKDLNPVEEAASYKRLIDEFGLTQEEVAGRVGKSRSAVNEILRVLTLPSQILEECRTSDTPKSLLLEIAKRPAGEQLEMWSQAKTGKLTVRGVRQAKTPSKISKEVSSIGMSFKYPITTEEAVVTVMFSRPKATPDEVIAALEEALAGEKERVR